MTFRPIIPGTGLTENEVIRSKDLPKRTGTKRIHGSRFKIHKHGAWNVPSTTSFIVIDIDTLKLKIGIAIVLSGGIDGVFVADNFPEFGSDLVTALPALDVEDFSHFLGKIEKRGKMRERKWEKARDCAVSFWKIVIFDGFELMVLVYFFLLSFSFCENFIPFFYIHELVFIVLWEFLQPPNPFFFLPVFLVLLF